MASSKVGVWAGSRIRFVTVATGEYVESAIYQARTILALGSWRPCDVLIVCTDRLCKDRLQSWHGGVLPALLFDTSPHCQNESIVERMPRGREKTIQKKARMRCLIATAKTRVTIDLMRGQGPGSDGVGETVLFMDLDVYLFRDPLRNLELDPKAVLAAQTNDETKLRSSKKAKVQKHNNMVRAKRALR